MTLVFRTPRRVLHPIVAAMLADLPAGALRLTLAAMYSAECKSSVWDMFVAAGLATAGLVA